MAEIVLDRVTKSYPDGAGGVREAVKELSMTIADGEFIILVGPSGCGKSTTLNMIAGLEEISSGELSIGGERVNEKAPKDRDIAMVFQSYALYPHMTVRQNIAFPLTLAKMKKDEIAAKVEETAKILDLTELLDRKPAQLSGGQRQRVAMGRAIVRSPKAFLMDEPLSNLDAKLRVQMRAEISRLQSRLGTTTVYVTHDQTEAMTLGDRVVVMLAGVVQQIGTPDELYKNPVNLFVAGFIGSPAMNFFPATFTDVGVRLPFGDVTLSPDVHELLARAPKPDNIIVGIRPEHLEDASLLDGYARIRALSFTVRADIVESLGSEKYIHFTIDGGGARAAQLAELVADSGAGENEFVARVSAESRVTAGQQIELAFDTSKLVIFDADSGLNLTRAIEPDETPEPEPEAEAAPAPEPEVEAPEATEAPEADVDAAAEPADAAEENPAAPSEPKAE
ncbi:ABC transporter ATP-binding protein [Mycobacterium dioxanotrophicus]|uniref:Trehalose import ATP-binding protein SugC n=1 Tax=Mycobacterium dioxanotrophicus TaxID=482462 RepID=A0A1Y0C0R0_9MYCO|nr:sn-glycerol-3-phosphate ABC transporter ATP-binding protein UgpC [Mycobacterium dioxanotrophicus]ART68732.1 ABC transporter ATP-binding protein [Mycobacterium dioxanotrophicus]